MTTSGAILRPRTRPVDVVLAIVMVLVSILSIRVVTLAAPFVSGICGAMSFVAYRRTRQTLWMVTAGLCAAVFLLSILAILGLSSGSVDVTSTSSTSS